eukprot:360127-Chlamydomonas_euryale.AAC.5
MDGAVVDMHMDGHRVAFNKAFVDLGYEVAVLHGLPVTAPPPNQAATTWVLAGRARARTHGSPGRPGMCPDAW